MLQIRAQRALLAGCQDVESAAEWLIEHDGDADIDDPLPLAHPPPGSPPPAATDEDVPGLANVDSAATCSAVATEAGVATADATQEEEGEADEEVFPPVDEELLESILSLGFPEVGNCTMCFLHCTTIIVLFLAIDIIWAWTPTICYSLFHHL